MKELNKLLMLDIVPLKIKVLIKLYWYFYYNNTYIPNKKMTNALKCPKRDLQRALSSLVSDNIITIYFVKNKRYFVFNDRTIKKKEDYEILNYNWLEDETEKM